MNFDALKNYPERLRRVKIYDAQNDRQLVFLTNIFSMPPSAIAELHKCQWHIELFFKLIKQNLRIKSFFGTSENAVKIQIWIAVTIYILVAILKKQLHVTCSLYTFLQVLSVNMFERVPIFQFVNDVDELNALDRKINQLNLFD